MGKGMMDEDELKMKAEVILRNHLLRCFDDVVNGISRYNRHAQGRGS